METFIFKSEYIKDGQATVVIDDVKRYSNGKSGSYYYAFTDKGRLKIDSSEYFLDQSLYTDIKEKYLNKECVVNVSKEFDLFTDWRITSLRCK